MTLEGNCTVYICNSFAFMLPAHAEFLLSWYVTNGVDEAIAAAPVDRFETTNMRSNGTQPSRRMSADGRSALRSADADRVVQDDNVEQESRSPDRSERAVVLAKAGTLGHEHEDSRFRGHDKGRGSNTPPATPPALAVTQARELADGCTTLAQLREVVETFDGCALRRMARHTVFADGNPEADVMLIGEAPGAEEDRQGIPFCGTSGQLLDTMFAAIGLTRETFYITNTLFWRPPGNRNPTPEELAICRPFVEKHMALVNPKLLVFIGGVAAKALLETTQGVTRLRGKEYHYTNQYLERNIPVRVLFHPSYLLRQPAHKRLAWQDLLTIETLLKSLP